MESWAGEGRSSSSCIPKPILHQALVPAPCPRTTHFIAEAQGVQLKGAQLGRGEAKFTPSSVRLQSPGSHSSPTAPSLSCLQGQAPGHPASRSLGSRGFMPSAWSEKVLEPQHSWTLPGCEPLGVGWVGGVGARAVWWKQVVDMPRKGKSGAWRSRGGLRSEACPQSPWQDCGCRRSTVLTLSSEAWTSRATLFLAGRATSASLPGKGRAGVHCGGTRSVGSGEAGFRLSEGPETSMISWIPRDKET